MIVLDSNVLVYAVGRDHPLRHPSRRCVEAIQEGRVAATTTVDVIQEFMVVRAHSQGRTEATQLAAEFATLLSPLMACDENDLRTGIRLFERHPELDAFDAVLAASAINRDAEAVVSADAAFAVVPRLRHVDPLSPDLDEVLRV